uniref:Uncharacterized protein n=1 Tax=Tetraselmis chuii TaxID=63592 RepID=A0A7S1WYZ4_9CHLO
MSIGFGVFVYVCYAIFRERRKHKGHYWCWLRLWLLIVWRQGPSLEEWRLQPRLGAGVSQLADEVAGRLELDGEGEEEEENEQEGGGGSQGGVSFANITRMGFAAAVDSPSLASPDNPPLPGAALTPSAAPLPAGAWGRPRPAPSSEPPAPSPPAAGGSRGRRGRKGTVLLSSTGGQRRY